MHYIRIKFLRVMQGGNLAGVHVGAGQCACWHCDETLSDSVDVAFCLSLLPIAEKGAMTSSLRVKNPSSVNTAYPSSLHCCLRVLKRCYCKDNHVHALWSVNINRLQRIMPVPEHTNWSLCIYCFCVSGDKSVHFLFLMRAKLQD